MLHGGRRGEETFVFALILPPPTGQWNGSSLARCVCGGRFRGLSADPRAGFVADFIRHPMDEAAVACGMFDWRVPPPGGGQEVSRNVDKTFTEFRPGYFDYS